LSIRSAQNPTDRSTVAILSKVFCFFFSKKKTCYHFAFYPVMIAPNPALLRDHMDYELVICFPVRRMHGWLAAIFVYAYCVSGP